MDVSVGGLRRHEHDAEDENADVDVSQVVNITEDLGEDRGVDEVNVSVSVDELRKRRRGRRLNSSQS